MGVIHSFHQGGVVLAGDVSGEMRLGLLATMTPTGDVATLITVNLHAAIPYWHGNPDAGLNHWDRHAFFPEGPVGEGTNPACDTHCRGKRSAATARETSFGRSELGEVSCRKCLLSPDANIVLPGIGAIPYQLKAKPERKVAEAHEGFVPRMIAHPLRGDLDIDPARQPIDQVGLLDVHLGGGRGLEAIIVIVQAAVSSRVDVGLDDQMSLIDRATARREERAGEQRTLGNGLAGFGVVSACRVRTHGARDEQTQNAPSSYTHATC